MRNEYLIYFNIIVHSDSRDHIPIIIIMIYNEKMLGMTPHESEHTIHHLKFLKKLYGRHLNENIVF